jgi:hypothetical protein
MEDPVHVLILAGAVFLVFALPAIVGLIAVLVERE